MKRLSAIVLIDVVKSLQTLHPHEKELSVDASFSIFAPLILDFLIGQALIGPLIAVCWRGTWIGFNVLLDDHLFPNHSDLNTAGCVILGISCLNLMSSLSTLLKWLCQEMKSQIGTFFVSRTFTLLSFGSAMILWKGWWDLCSIGGPTLYQGLACLLMGLVVMMCLGNTRSSIGFPLAIQLDSKEHYFRINSYSLFEPNHDQFSPGWIWTFNAINSVLNTLSELMVISCWFGVWNTEDKISRELWGKGTPTEAIMSCFIGVLVALLTFVCQFWFLLHLMETFVEHNVQRSILHFGANQILAVMGLFATVSKLRGVWYLLDIYCPEDQLSLSLVGTVVLSFSLLVVLGCGSTLHGGIIRDPKPGEPFLIPGFYSTYFFVRKLQFQRNEKDHEVFLAQSGRAPLATCDTETPMTDLPA